MKAPAHAVGTEMITSPIVYHFGPNSGPKFQVAIVAAAESAKPIKPRTTA